MSELLEEAVNELKRADHMIFVSLKYTRTVDVIKNIVARLISCFDSVFEYLLEHLKETKKILDIPQARAQKLEVLREFFVEDKVFQDFIAFYLSLRRVNKAEFTRRQEFRRHVTMTAILEDDQSVELNIDIIHDYYMKTKAFVDYAVKFVNPSEE